MPGFGPGLGPGCGPGWRRGAEGPRGLIPSLRRQSRCLSGTSSRGQRLSLLRRRGGHLGELRQTAFEEVVGLRVHGKGMDLPGRGQAAHRFPHPRARGQREREKSRSLRSRRRRPTAGTWRPAAKSPLPGKWRCPWRGPRGAAPEQFPSGRLALRREHRADAQRLPELAQGAQNRGFGELAAKCFPGRGGGQCALFAPAPSTAPAPGERPCGRRIFAEHASNPHRARRARMKGSASLWARKSGCSLTVPSRFSAHHGAGGDEARQQPVRLLDRGRSGRGVRAPHAGFDKRRRGRRQLGAPGQVKTQADAVETSSARPRG